MKVKKCFLELIKTFWSLKIMINLTDRLKMFGAHHHTHGWNQIGFQFLRTGFGLGYVLPPLHKAHRWLKLKHCGNTQQCFRRRWNMNPDFITIKTELVKLQIILNNLFGDNKKKRKKKTFTSLFKGGTVLICS